MSVCGLFSSFLLFLVLTVTVPPTRAVVKILSPCSVNSQCPDKSTCLHVLGKKQCTCNKGYMASMSLAVCERAVYLSEPCITRCVGLFVICHLPTKLCVCSAGYVRAAGDKNCVTKDKGLLEEACGAGCEFYSQQVCVDGVCRCKLNLRPMTREEIRALNNPPWQCIKSTYSSDGSKTTTAFSSKELDGSKTTTASSSKELDHSTASFTPTSQANHTEPPLQDSHTKPPSQANYTDPPHQANHTKPPFQGNHTNPPSQANHTEPLDDNGTIIGDSNTSEMTMGVAAGTSTAVLLTLIAFVVVVVVVRRRKSRVYGKNTRNKSLNVTEKGCRSYLDASEPTVDRDGVNSVTEGSKLPSRDVPSVVYSNFKIKENKAKQAIMTKRQGEETPQDDSTYNTLSTANVKSRDNEPDHMDGYNTLYNMNT